MQTWEYCKVNNIGGKTYLYSCDDSGNNIANPKRCLNLKTVLAELEHDGWELMNINRCDHDRITYIYCRPSTNLA